MLINEINVTRLESGTWYVSQGKSSSHGLAFKSKACAVAYARALACSAHSDLYLPGPGGVKVRQPTESLTYPTALD